MSFLMIFPHDAWEEREGLRLKASKQKAVGQPIVLATELDP